MSGWSLGAVTFPKPPKTVTYKAPANFKEITVVIEQPWVMSMGAGTPKLSLQGEFFYKGSGTEAIHNSYLNRITKYTKRPQVIDEPLLGDVAGSGTWHSAGMNTFKNTGALKVKYEESINGRFGASDKFYREFDSYKDFSAVPTFVIWCYGDSGNWMKVTFSNVPYASTAQGYRDYFQAGNKTWNKTVFSKSSADNVTGKIITNTTGTPTGWDKIRTIIIEPSGTYPASTTDFYYDAFYAAHAWELDAPGTRYDGLYAVADVETKEVGGNIHSLEYKITLLDKTNYYGEV